MFKPKNYDNTTTGFVPVDLGGHIAVIKSVNERQNKNGGDMIVVYIDFADEDAQRGYFQTSYNADTRKDKKWPNAATSYINVTDADGNTTTAFKAFITAYEESNGVAVIWKSGFEWGEQFIGKKIGVIYGEEENYYNDELRTVRKIRRFTDKAKAPTAEIPAKRLYKGEMGTHTSVMPAEQTSPMWMDIPDAEESPFR